MGKQGKRNTGSLGYMPGLDGLRALAVFAVIAYHLNLAWIPGGFLGVNLFFVLSGYLITNILLTQWDSFGTVDLKDFWVRRARRLLPALLFMLLGVMLWIILFAPERAASLSWEALAALFYSSNWYLVFHQTSYFDSFGPQSPFGHLWSLAVEGQFYLLWPLFLGLGLRHLPQRGWVILGTAVVTLMSALAMALIYTPGYDPSRAYYGTDTRAFDLLAGAVLAMVWPSRKMSAKLPGKNRQALDIMGCAGLAIVLFMVLNTNQYQSFPYRGGLLLFAFAAACLIAALAHPQSYLGMIFQWRPLRWLGKCSYGIYLWHYPVIVLTNPAVNTNGFNTALAFWQVVACIILASLSLYLVEQPFRHGRSQSVLKRSYWVNGGKVAVSMLLAFLLLFANPNGGSQIAAKDLAEGGVSVQQNQAAGYHDTDAYAQTDGDTQTHTTHGPNVGSEAFGIDNTGAGAGAGAGEATRANDSTGVSEGSEVSSAGNELGIEGSEITVIGDSLIIGVEPLLEECLPGIVIEAEIGRQMNEAGDIISGFKEDGQLGEIVIIELGTNGPFTEKQIGEVLDSLQGCKQVLLINTRVSKPWESVVNDMLKDAHAAYENTQLIDWYAASGGHDEYFYPDGLHLNKTGAEAYLELVMEALASF